MEQLPEQRSCPFSTTVESPSPTDQLSSVLPNPRGCTQRCRQRQVVAGNWSCAVNGELHGDSGPVDVAALVHGQHDEVVSSVSARGTLGVLSAESVKGKIPVMILGPRSLRGRGIHVQHGNALIAWGVASDERYRGYFHFSRGNIMPLVQRHVDGGESEFVETGTSMEPSRFMSHPIAMVEPSGSIAA